MVLWSVTMAVVLFTWEARAVPQEHALAVGLAVTALLGVYLGWRRRSAAVFVAPLVSWLFAWFPLMVAAMIHHGVVKGFFVGLFLITVGWLGIGATEFVWLGLVAFLVRLLRGPGDRGEPDVVIFGPDGK